MAGPACPAAGENRGPDSMSKTATAGKFVPISKSRHAGRYWRRFTSYEFARGLRQVPIVLGEQEQAAANFPILFRAAGPEGAQWSAPVAMLRLSAEGESPFVAPNGIWRAHYVPSILRVHPFGARPGRPAEGADGDVIQMAVLVDEASGLISDDPNDEPFFNAEGEIDQALAEVVAFFRQRTNAARKTQLACAALGRADLLTEVDTTQPGMAELAGFHVVNRARLEALDDTAISQLYRSGALALAFAHFVSLAHVAFLQSVEVSIENSPATGQTSDIYDYDSSERLSGFLDALAASQDSETGQS
mgnify:CR=1 FL=1